ncbi:unnamed protein product [Chondrus crispus]|uniref:Uncharacterized protein n=1 Tax=Chondrus crispus TaxID=2769 RepID=S0F3I0_CHOCR|nr:unnamed protein product [Chondrus crispus]CDF77414.1 unnamed protein product [Chondrus crispus]|eukprot:XP_005712288.1 unnamed protein product [Chondrus crispus]
MQLTPFSRPTIQCYTRPHQTTASLTATTQPLHSIFRHPPARQHTCPFTHRRLFLPFDSIYSNSNSSHILYINDNTYQTAPFQRSCR